MMELTIIDRHKRNGNIAFYVRYVDDVYCVLRKGTASIVLNAMNSFDPMLQFTIEYMACNKLSFLNTSTFVDENSILQLRKYRKESSSDVTLHFHLSMPPIKYKISSLVGDIYRCNYTCTTDIELEKTLCDIEHQYLRNGYPQHIIRSKIKEVKDKNFASSEKRLEREREAKLHS